MALHPLPQVPIITTLAAAKATVEALKDICSSELEQVRADSLPCGLRGERLHTGGRWGTGWGAVDGAVQCAQPQCARRVPDHYPGAPASPPSCLQVPLQDYFK